MEGDTKRGGKKLDFNMLVAVVNNSLIAYDQARDLASVIDAAIRANNDRGGEGEGGARRSTADSDGGLLDDSEIHVEMEECNRCAPRARVVARCHRQLHARFLVQGGRAARVLRWPHPTTCRARCVSSACVLVRPPNAGVRSPASPGRTDAPLLRRGFLNVSKVALDKVVQSIFEDQGTSDVLRALFKGADWCNGVTTHSVLLTLADYLSDLESWLDPPFYRRACQVRPARLRCAVRARGAGVTGRAFACRSA